MGSLVFEIICKKNIFYNDKRLRLLCIPLRIDKLTSDNVFNRTNDVIVI